MYHASFTGSANSTNNSTFSFTDSEGILSNELWGYTAVVGAAISSLVLCVIGIVAWDPQSRRTLDRVSFRVTTVALAANVAYAITNAVGGTFTGPAWGCSFSIWVLQLCLEISGFLTFCIGLNLQLVLVHGFDGQKLEKYYFIISVALSLALTVPPYATKQYGWDPVVRDCWYSNPKQNEQLAWQIGTQLIWTLLTILGELITATWVFIFMYRHSRRVATNNANITSTRESQTRSTHRHHGGVHDDSESYATRLRRVVFRVWLYPVTSCIINATNVALVLVGTINGIRNQSEYDALLLSDFLYGARAIVYALLAATDPALARGVRHLYRRYRPMKKTSPRRLGFGTETTVTISRPNDSTNSTTYLHGAKSHEITSGSVGKSGILSRLSNGHIASPSRVPQASAVGRGGKLRSRSRSRTRYHHRPGSSGPWPPLQLSSIQVHIESTSVQHHDIDTPIVEFHDYTSQGRTENDTVEDDELTAARGRTGKPNHDPDLERAGDLDGEVRSRSQSRPRVQYSLGDGGYMGPIVETPPQSATSPDAHAPFVTKLGEHWTAVLSPDPPFSDAARTSSTTISPNTAYLQSPQAFIHPGQQSTEVYGLDLFSPHAQLDSLDDLEDNNDDNQDATQPHIYSEAKRREMEQRRRQKQKQRTQADEARRAKQEDFMRSI